MRDLQGIAEINGPRRAELQAERAANVKENSPGTGWVLFQSLHGDRVKARRAQRTHANRLEQLDIADGRIHRIV